LAVLTFTAICANGLAAETLSQLYGITSDGKLYQINKATAYAVPARVPLPSSYSNFQALAYSNGYFYAAYGAGRIMKFGFKHGDEVDLGASGFYIVKGLAFNSSGVLYAAGSVNQDTYSQAYPESIGTINLSNGAASNVVSVASSEYCVAGALNMTGLAFRASGDLFALFHEVDNQATCACYFNLTTGELSPHFSSNDWGFYNGYTLGFEDIAIDPTNGVVYGGSNVNGLYTLVENTPNHTWDATQVGEYGSSYGGVPAMMGLTFGPKRPPRGIEPILRLLTN
jgi:hypothetical protein